jgi:GNAT superfamily N-acetyltransferase
MPVRNTAFWGALCLLNTSMMCWFTLCSLQFRYTVKPADFKSLSTASFLMNRERFNVPNPLTDPRFIESYQIDLERLEKNFPLTDGSHKVAMAVDDETKQLVGYIDIDQRFRTHGAKRLPPPFICDLVVDREWRRQGVGAALLRYAEDVCFNPNQWSNHKLYLIADADNTVATTMYLKQGYRPIQFEKGPHNRIESTNTLISVLSQLLDSHSHSVVDNDIINCYTKGHDYQGNDLPFMIELFATTIVQEWDRVLFMKSSKLLSQNRYSSNDVEPLDESV